MSDKFKIIDHATFAKIQQNNSSAAPTKTLPKIRNSKYKRMTASDNFNLLQFINKAKQRGKLKSTGGALGINVKIKRKRVIDSRIVVPKRKGKRREDGRKKPTRLKKSILQYRQKKRQESQQLAQQLLESVDKLSKLELKDNDAVKTSNDRRFIVGLHSNTFRDYCNCCRSPELKKHCEQLIRELNHFQRRAYAQNPIKARAHQRFVVGFRQVQSYLRINKVKLVVIATDCEHNEGDVSLDDIIENIKTTCKDQQIPIVFAFRRRELAYFLYKKASISCIGILDYDGAREIFGQVMEALNNAREMYETLLLKN